MASDRKNFLDQQANTIRAALPASDRKGLVVLAAEDVSVFAVDLPIRSARQRLAAAGFAIEDRLAASLEATHVALGPKLEGDRYLVAATALGQMPGMATGPVIPEQMALPAPSADSGPSWAALRQGDRVLVRVSDGTGFAAQVGQIGVLWQAFGRPRVISYGAALPPELKAQDRSEDAPRPAQADLQFDLRQGVYSTAPSLLRRSLAAGVAALVLAATAQIGVTVWDVRRAEAHLALSQASLATRIDQIAPGLPVSTAAVSALDRQIARRQTPDQDAFLALLVAASDGLAATPSVTLMALDYSDEGPALVLQLQASGIDVLRGLATQLAQAGLEVETGTLSATDAGAETTLTLRGAAQ